VTLGSGDPRPAIVAVAYDRPASLERLLGSLGRASYPAAGGVPLVVSIDHGGDPRVREVAEAFPWPHGPKEVIAQGERLGLREHILRCGDLSRDHGAVIVLEDDLYVSRRFYAFAVAALGYYGDDDRIAGVSLYGHRTNVFCREPFDPLDDGADVFFLQLASSWGQAWTRRQWDEFRTWYGDGREVTAGDPVPDGVIAWPDSSWLKRFVAYMVETGRQFVYPRVSLSTNFGDPGTHFDRRVDLFQVPLRRAARDHRFVSLDDSGAVYDAHFELTPACLDRLTDRFHGYAYEVDLYGTKRLDKVRAPHLLTGRACRNAVATFGGRLRPAVMNVIEGVAGDDIAFGPTGGVADRYVAAPRPGSYADFRLRFGPKEGLVYGLRGALDRIAGRK
jgi:hypothetical protein